MNFFQKIFPEQEEKIKIIQQKLESLQKQFKKQNNKLINQKKSILKQNLKIKKQKENIEKQRKAIKNQKNQLIKQKENIKKQNLKFEKLHKQLKKYTVWQNNFYREIPVDYPALLSSNEKELLIKYFKESKNYLEFGPGGSTFAALLNSNCNITTVESDLDWIDYLRTYKFIRNSENNRLNFIHVDIGTIKNVGKPLNDEKKEDYPNYSTGIYAKLNSKKFDLAFIDGRFRVACVLGVILNCSKDIKILVHDYSYREYYHIIEEFLDVVETSDTLYVFKTKNEINKNKIAELYEKYKYQYE